MCCLNEHPLNCCTGCFFCHSHGNVNEEPFVLNLSLWGFAGYRLAFNICIQQRKGGTPPPPFNVLVDATRHRWRTSNGGPKQRLGGPSFKARDGKGSVCDRPIGAAGCRQRNHGVVPHTPFQCIPEPPPPPPPPLQPPCPCTPEALQGRALVGPGLLWSRLSWRMLVPSLEGGVGGGSRGVGGWVIGVLSC